MKIVGGKWSNWSGGVSLQAAPDRGAQGRGGTRGRHPPVGRADPRAGHRAFVHAGQRDERHAGRSCRLHRPEEHQCRTGDRDAWRRDAALARRAVASRPGLRPQEHGRYRSPDTRRRRRHGHAWHRADAEKFFGRGRRISAAAREWRAHQLLPDGKRGDFRCGANLARRLRRDDRDHDECAPGLQADRAELRHADRRAVPDARQPCERQPAFRILLVSLFRRCRVQGAERERGAGARTAQRGRDAGARRARRARTSAPSAGSTRGCPMRPSCSNPRTACSPA